MSLPWSEHAQNDEDTGRSVASIPGRGGGRKRERREERETGEREGGESRERKQRDTFSTNSQN
jgi:hypothetical protein